MVALEPVRTRAIRLLDLHPLMTADSLQLAAALIVAKDQPKELPFVTLDPLLAEPARKEGLSVEIASWIGRLGEAIGCRELERWAPEVASGESIG